MKVGTDAVLLGALTDLRGSKNILDVGTGCGIIALMTAQRQPKAQVIAIDLDSGSIREAAENFRRSPWPDRLQAIESSFQSYSENTSQRFDHIVSNPPFFTGDSRSIYPSRTKSRHTVYLSHEAFIQSAGRVAVDSARISVILPVSVSSHFIRLAEIEGFYLWKVHRIRPRPDLPVNRMVLQFSSRQGLLTETDFTLYDPSGNYSDAYVELTKEFHPDHLGFMRLGN